jgi:DNA-binding NarL/FixJ family response regulator
MTTSPEICHRTAQPRRNGLGIECTTMLNTNQQTARAELGPTDLTNRELQIVRLLMKGKPNKIIAYELHLREGTIKEYNNDLFKKLGLSNRTEVALWGRDHIF